jgi:hypothetical protein
MKHLTKWSLALLGSFLCGSLAFADIPPPPGGNDRGPNPPGSQGPNGAVCNTGAGAIGNPDQAPPVPGGCPTSDPTHPNDPPQTWFNEMHTQLSLLERAAHGLEGYGMGSYVSRLVYVIDTFYGYAYDDFGRPRFYPSFGGYPTRGDFNFLFYFWIRPIVFDVFYYGVNYVQYGSYIQAINDFDDAYHGLTQCMYGAKAGDPTAFDDLEAQAAERAAGVQHL